MNFKRNSKIIIFLLTRVTSDSAFSSENDTPKGQNHKGPDDDRDHTNPQTGAKL